MLYLQLVKKREVESDYDRNLKVLSIVEAAQKRFGIFGIEKTSMREIAADLHLSKASLYYYFPDKERLYRAVLEKEQDEFIMKITEGMLNIHDPEKLLIEYVRSRSAYFRTLLNLSRLRIQAFSELKPVLREANGVFREKEKKILKDIFEKGIRKGIFHIEDTDKTASLFLDLLRGLRVSVVTDKNTLIIEDDEYSELLANTLVFTDIFISGISNKRTGSDS
jgi:AcrR family transcriptional regulator